MVKSSLEVDGRVIELRRLGDAERELSRELVSVHEEIANLVQSWLPPHAPESHIAEVVTASGYGRNLIDRLRGGNHPWHKPTGKPG